MLDGSIVSGPKKEFSVHVNIPKTLGSYYGDIEIELNGFPRSTELIDNNHQTLPIKITVVTLEPSDPQRHAVFLSVAGTSYYCTKKERDGEIGYFPSNSDGEPRDSVNGRTKEAIHEITIYEL